MLNSSPEFAAAITGDVREVLAKAIVDIVDPDIIYHTPTSSGHLAYSRMEQLYNKVMSGAARFATLEPYRWVLDGTWDIFPDDPAETDGEVGYISDVLCDENNVFAYSAWVQLNLENSKILQAAAVFFTDITEDGFGVDFTVDVYSGDDIVHSESVADNSERAYYIEGFTVYNATAIRVTPTRWSMPHRRARSIEIVPGTYEEWLKDTIYTLDIIQEVSFSCMALPYGEAALEIFNRNRRFDPRNKSGLFASITERQGIPLFMGVRLPGGGAEYVPCGVYYQRDGGWELGNDGLTIKFKLVDILGLLAERKFRRPAVLPGTAKGWIVAILSQLGDKFKERYIIDSDIADTALTCTADDVNNITCGQLLRFVCMAVAAFPRADAATGYLRVSLVPESGGASITRDNMHAFPVQSANDDVAAITFQLADGSNTQYTVGGTSGASATTLSIANFFIKTASQANTAARGILRNYGGQRYEIRGRGDFRSELGDVDVVDLGLDSAAGGRRYMQRFKIGTDGTMQNVPSYLVQATGEKQYSNTVVVTQGGAWTAPDGVTELRIVLVGGGSGGESGERGSYFGSVGAGGAGGLGGRVYIATISINPGQTLTAAIGAGGASGALGSDTLFAAYSSASGVRYNGWTDMTSGNVYGLTGATGRSGQSSVIVGASGAEGTGNGGGGGSGGAPAILSNGTTGTIVREPINGGQGGSGGSGCVIISYDIAEVAV